MGRQPPVEVQGVHSQSLVHARAVGQEGGKAGLEDETKLEDGVLHSLLEDGVLPCLTDNQVSPLDNDDGDKEGSVTGVLEDLSVGVGPLLSVGVFQVIDSRRIPGSSDSKESAWPESVLCHDDKVDEESSAGLDHTNLTVGHGDQSLIDKFVSEGVPGLSLHDVGLCLLVGHGDGGHHVGSQVDTQDGDGSKRKWDISQDEEKEGGDLGNVGGQGVGDGLLQVVKDKTTLLDSSNNGGKVVIKQDHVSGLFGDVRSSDTHGNSNVSLLESRRVIDTISSDGNNGSHSLTTLDNDQLLLGRGSGEDNLSVVHQDLINLLLGHLLDLSSVDDASSGISGVDVLDIDSLLLGNVLDSVGVSGDDSDVLCDGLGGDGMVSGDHDDLDTGGSALGDGVRDSGSWRINHGHETDESESLQGEVDILGVEWVSNGVLVSGKHVVAETKDTFSESSKLHVGGLESISPFLSEWEFSSINNNGGASVDNSLRSSLHDQEISVVVLVLSLVNGDLELVGGVEGDLADLLVLLSVLHDVSAGQLGTLEDSSLGGVSVDLSLQDGDSFLTSLELSTIAKSGNSLQGLPSTGVLPCLGSSRLVLGGIGLDNLVVKPHVSNGHSVLGQGSGLVRADGGGGAEGLHGLQVLDQAVLGGHPLGGQGETHGDGGQETLRDVGDDDSDQEDDGVQPVVAEDEGGDDVDKMGNFLGNGSFVRSQTRGKTSNSTHDSLISDIDNDSNSSSFNSICGEERKILGFQWIF